MLLTALKDRFSRYFNSDPANDTILWFDPERDYAELLAPLKAAGVPLRLVEREGELIRVRYELQSRQPGARIVVYLPWKPDSAEADWLTPVIPLADVFAESLFRFLSHLGVAFPEDPKTRNAIKDVLPRLAGQSLGKGAGYWQKVLASLDAVREELLGDFGETLLRFLAMPDEVRRELRTKEIDNFFFGLLSGRYGFDAVLDEEPAAIARRLTAQLVAIRAFVTADRPDDFPFPNLLPAPHLLNTCEEFLRRWQDSSYRPIYVRLASQLETRYSLKDWVARLPFETALRLSPTFLDVEAQLWERVEAALGGLQTDSDWAAFMSQHRAAFVTRADGFWVREGKADQWTIARQASDLLLAIGAVEHDLTAIPTAEALIQRYAAPDGWWRVDRAYRELREAIGDATKSFDRLRRQCGRRYHHFLDRLNGRFVELLGKRDRWALADLPEQTAVWNERIKVEKGKRAAVIFVDALRFELAHALMDRLGRDIDSGDLAVQARVVTLPAVTKVCMPALLPDGQARKVDYADDWRVTIGDSGNLADKAERETYLRVRYPRIQIYSKITDLLNLPADQIPASAELYVTFHTALDNVGENAHELALTVFGELLKDVERAIRKLREAEVDEIFVLTDHGFLLLDEIAEADKAPVKDVPALKKASRYLVGRGLGYTDQLRFPVPGSDGLEAWFPRGIGCFRTPGKYNYAHGGLSLQEIVIPCLTITRKAAGSIVAVELIAPAEIWGKLEKVKVRPLAVQLLDRAREVELILEKEGRRVISLRQVIEPGSEAEIKVLFPDDAPLEMGDKVVWRLLDGVTGQALGEQSAVNRVDFF